MGASQDREGGRLSGNVGIMAFKGENKILGPGTLAGFDFGIRLVNQGHDSVRGVAAIANAIGIGVNSKDNSVRDNVTVHNVVVGIDLFVSTTGNTIEGNFAQANHLDLRDNIPDCAGNIWSGNDFINRQRILHTPRANRPAHGGSQSRSVQAATAGLAVVPDQVVPV
jgi:parallel beta-helix repeat protein